MGKIYSTSLERKMEVDDSGLGKISIGSCTPEHTVLFPMAFESFRRRVESPISMICKHWRPIGTGATLSCILRKAPVVNVNHHLSKKTKMRDLPVMETET